MAHVPCCEQEPAASSHHGSDDAPPKRLTKHLFAHDTTVTDEDQKICSARVVGPTQEAALPRHGAQVTAGLSCPVTDDLNGCLLSLQVQRRQHFSAVATGNIEDPRRRIEKDNVAMLIHSTR